MGESLQTKFSSEKGDSKLMATPFKRDIKIADFRKGASKWPKRKRARSRFHARSVARHAGL